MSKLLLPLLAILLFVSCKKQISTDKPSEEIAGVAAKSSKKIVICHYLPKRGNWQTMTINAKDLQTHLAHGDIVPDADGDGYTKVNPCGNGGQDDCNDNNVFIHPRAVEICGNGVDENCNGRIDENCIPSVVICNQAWMLKNLDVSTYRNGDLIPEVTNDAVWATLTTGAWCYYQNNSANGPVYGKLYNWYAVNDPRGLAPAGWRIPTDVDWTTLSTCLGGTSVAGGKMKETGIIHWTSPNTSATNSSVFTGLAGGHRSDNGIFGSMGNDGIWWSATEYDPKNVWIRYLYYFDAQIFRSYSNKLYGLSVRCVRN